MFQRYYGIACLYDDSRLILTTSNNHANSVKSYFHEILSISLKLIRLISLFFKIPVEKNKCQDHELYKRSFDDKKPCILYVHDLFLGSRIKGLKNKLKLEV